MRKINKKNTFDKMNKEILCISAIFVLCVTIGACLNKLYPGAQESIIQNISGTIEYYNSSINLKRTIISNLKMDALFLCSIPIFTSTIVLLPISIGNFILKGLSVGYTINSLVLGMKIKSVKIIFITLIKCVVVLPSALILSIISAKYVVEMINEIKRNNKGKMIYLIKTYFLNSAIIITITLITQLILNAISIATLQVFF